MRASPRSRKTSCASGRWAVLLLAPLTIAFGGGAYAQTYDVTDLGALKGYSYSRARALNDAVPLQVAGDSVKTPAAGPDTFAAFRWLNGKMTKLGTLGGTNSLAYGINLGGWVVGASDTRRDKARHAFLWVDGTMTDLGTLGGSFSQADDVNDSGVVVGMADTTAGARHAFRWDNGTMVDLGALGGDLSRACAVNDAGEVAGYTDACPGSDWCGHAALWRSGTIVDLGTLSGANESWLWDLNDVGVAVGGSSTTAAGPPYRAIRWEDENANGVSDPGEMVDLGTLGPYQGTYTESDAAAVNNLGEVVGYSSCPSVPNGYGCAFVWDEVNGMRDLNALISPNSGWELTHAYDINDAGQIVGIGYKAVPQPPYSIRAAFLLTPR